MSVLLLKTTAVLCAYSVEIGLKEQVQGSSAAMFGVPGRAGQHYPGCGGKTGREIVTFSC